MPASSPVCGPAWLAGQVPKPEARLCGRRCAEGLGMNQKWVHRGTALPRPGPALADANNGNWQTARRWQALLSPHSARIVKQWPDALAEQDQVMLALHACRSADSVQAWHAQRSQRGLGVVLTGTDLYRDIATDADAQRSLALAHRLIVLQEQGPLALPDAL
eukprot:gene60013-80035_t